MVRTIVWNRQPDRVRGAISTRAAGDLGWRWESGDPALAATTARLRRRFAKAAGFDLTRAVGLRQVHGNRVYEVPPEHPGAGGNSPAPLGEGDALYTAGRGVPLLAVAADCATVFLADPRGRAIGLAHAGWRGVLAGVVTETVRALRTQLGAGAPLCVGIGPSIGPCCLEMGETEAEQFADRFGEQVVVRPDGATRPFVDLWTALRCELHELGLDSEIPSPVCSRCEWSCFSHRRAGGRPTGRMLAVLWREG